MRNTLIFLATLGLVLSLGVAAQATTIYTNEAAFSAAFPSPIRELFDDSILQPGLSVHSDYSAYIANGVYNDRVGNSGNYTTTWTNSQGFTAFGGNFDLSPGGPGTGIHVTADGLEIGQIDNSYIGGFWGFSTGDTFYNVVFSMGNQDAVAETYKSPEIAYTQVPEPATLLLLGAGLVGLVAFGRKFRK